MKAPPDIDEHTDYVIIEGQRVNRPSRIAPSEWLQFWEYVSTLVRPGRKV